MSRRDQEQTVPAPVTIPAKTKAIRTDESAGRAVYDRGLYRETASPIQDETYMNAQGIVIWGADHYN